ncbi:MAG: hypothetical protein AAGK97_18585, partial [Bacteroidota bacterium]
YNGDITGAEVGSNAADLEGCFDLSNPITVVREYVASPSITTADGLTDLTICAGDGVSDAFDVVTSGGAGENAAWIITDDQLNILALPPSPPFDLEGAGAGVCLVWYVRFNGSLTGVAVGNNVADVEGCYALSNPITVTREAVEASSIFLSDGSTETTICAGDGNPDPLNVFVSGGAGENAAWVITDDQLNILALPPSPPFDLEGAGPGTCLIWYLRYNGDIVGAEVGLNAADLEGCFALSNPITVERLTGDDCPPVCMAPTEFSVTRLNGSRVLVDWNDVDFAQFYITRYRRVGVTRWRYRISFTSQQVLNGIRVNRTYEYQVITSSIIRIYQLN